MSVALAFAAWLSLGEVVTGLSCIFAGPLEVTMHYRLSLHVEVDGEEVEGSGVFGQRFGGARKGCPRLQDRTGNYWGEAVPVVLPGRGTLFAIMMGSNRDTGTFYAILPRTFGVTYNGVDGAEPYIAGIAALSGTREVPPDYVPLLVRFDDPANSASIHRVYPDRLEESFGPGVRFLRATVTVVEEQPVDRGIRELLPFLNVDPDDLPLPGSPDPNVPPPSISDYDREEF